MSERVFTVLRKFKYHWIDTLVTVVLWILGLVCTRITPYNRFFTERDPTLSYPFIHSESIPTWLLLFLCLLVPSVIILFSQVIIRWRFNNLGNRHKVADFFLAQAVLFQALGLTLFITTLLKVFFGRHRPNFFALCNYKGYNDAISSGDFTAYFNSTSPNLPGDIKYCLSSHENINESRFSHPSGHASMAFSGLGYLSFFLFHLLLSHKPTSRNHMWKAIVFLVPLSVAGLVAATRTRDYWHFFDDTLFGTLLGLGCAATVFYINYSRRTKLNVEYIGDLFPKNGGDGVGEDGEDAEDGLSGFQNENRPFDTRTPPSPKSSFGGPYYTNV